LAIDCKFEFIEDGDNANLCSIPLLNFDKFLPNVDSTNQTEMQFYAFGTALLEKGLLPSIEVLKKLLNRLSYSPKIIFPHSVSSKIIQEATVASKLNLNIYSIFTELGNIATVSIPAAITKAMQTGVITKNDKCVAWVASAGMKFAAFEVYL
jgi:3-oxoacyl-[acyl-carrier-protein] synthase III